jgi:glutamyl-tRNA synthetase
MKKIVTRFAPSPTGFMHIGGVRTALFAYLWARKNEGTFILRIEDTDKSREVAGSIGHIQESLQWIGIDWDYGPDKENPFGSAIQSERLDTYRAAAQTLIDAGFAYPDPYSAEELAAFRQKAQDEKRPFLFRDHRPAIFGVWDGTKPLRFKTPEIKRSVWNDAVRGELEAGPEMLDDFVLIKTDGYPTYNFAHIIDDMHMGVTHIMRADEFIASTPKFLSLYDALGIEYPVFVTLPPILRDDKTKKMGKRDGAKDILEYRAEGYLPEAMLNFLAFIGWNPGTEQELFTKKELIHAFDIQQIQRHGGIVNDDKLDWYNRQYIAKLNDADFAAAVIPALETSVKGRGLSWAADRATKLLPIIKERISVWSDILKIVEAGEFDFFFKDPEPTVSEIPGKGNTSEAAAAHLSRLHEMLESAAAETFDSPERLKDMVWDYATAEGRGAVLWPLRFSLSGLAKSPDPFVIAAVIGRDATLRRITNARTLLI